jgi:Acyl-protein synthetase, LuxE
MTANRTFSELAKRVLAFVQSHPIGSEGDRTFTELALALFALQYQHLPVYQRFCEARLSDPSRIADWREIPAISTGAFKEIELTSLPPRERTRVFRSSGTVTQQRSRHFHNEQSLRIYEASLALWFGAHLLAQAPRAMDLLILTPSPEAAPDSSLVHMFATIRRTFKFADAVFLGRGGEDAAWSLDLAEAERRLRRCISANQPVLMLGTAFSFVHLLDHLAPNRESLLLPEGSRAMETGGYKGRSRALPRGELHALVCERLGLTPGSLVSEYGMSELSSQAYDQVARADTSSIQTDTPPRFFRFPPWARVQIVSPETGREVDEGETGLVQVIDLANVYSVLSVQTEDLAVRHKTGFELLGRAVRAEPRGCSLMAQ